MKNGLECVQAVLGYFLNVFLACRRCVLFFIGRDEFNIVIDMNSTIFLHIGLIVLGFIPIFANIYPCRHLGILFKFRNGQLDGAVITSASGKNGLKAF